MLVAHSLARMDSFCFMRMVKGRTFSREILAVFIQNTLHLAGQLLYLLVQSDIWLGGGVFAEVTVMPLPCSMDFQKALLFLSSSSFYWLVRVTRYPDSSCVHENQSVRG